LKSIHDFVRIAVRLQPDEFATLVKTGNLVNFAVLISIPLDYILLRPYLSGQKRYGKNRNDNDGQFEITQWFDKSPWSMVMKLDADLNGKPEGRYCYKEGVLRLKEIDENGDGKPDLKEHYNAQGKLGRATFFGGEPA